ncbi:Ectopic P granules protein 5 [Chionoecetes opilio]|uniref:Ectopic P granules protein 5 n=1 Tax=Chionoecetes opilio TaxID=41210 RepID=A0A8J5CRR5_CHIOP|nr:Ectopic P granules protein 5 [Chionoecetes opilio]
MNGRFSEARLNERENARVEQNREQSEGVVQRCLKPPPLQLCQAAVSLEAIITTLVNRFRKAKREESKQILSQLLTSGRQVFYHIVQLTSEDTCAYPPAKQLITSCAEVLGQEFVSGHGDCQENLVCEVVEWGGQVGGLLAPHFTPTATSTSTFLALYASLARHASTSPDHTFMLLSKLYRVHLKSLLNHKFPQHYMEVLHILLQVSASTQEDCGGVSSGLWYDLINSLGGGVACFSPDMARQAVVQAVNETLKMLSNYFVKQRLEFGLYGLYPKYRLHIGPMSVFLCLMSHTYIATTLHARPGVPQEEVVQEVWRAVEGVWAGWVAPLGGADRQTCPDWLRHLTHDIQLLLPWAPSDASAADAMVAMFAASVDYIHELLPGQSSVLSLLLEYYSGTFAVREVKSHVLVVVHTHLAALPWHHLHPSLQDTLTLCKVVEQYLPECHSFIGQVLVQINWGKVLEAALAPPTSATQASQGLGGSECLSPARSFPPDPVAARLHTCLLNLLVRISMEPSVRQSPLLQTLLLESERFAWWLIDGDSFQRVVNWWVMSCDPRIILTMPNRNPVDISIVQ